MNTGDTGFMIICAAFVFFMTPGLAFFYGGLVRRKNVVNTMMACVAIMGLSVFMWTLFGYSLAFGGNHGGIIGDFRWFGLENVGMEAGPYACLLYTSVIFSGVTPEKGGFQDFDKCIEETHASWMICAAIRKYSGVTLENARKASVKMGYDLRVSKAYYEDVYKRQG